jgi:erythronate-4-phosphate dehydrogenase
LNFEFVWNLEFGIYMPTIIIDDHIPFIKGILEPYAKIIYAPGGRIDRQLASQADGLIIRTRTFCNADLLEGTPVKFIATATIGYDHIDTDYCENRNISWHHAPGCNSSSVRQYMASTLVTLALKNNFSLNGKKIGIIGVGHVGSKVAQLANSLGMISLLNDPPREKAENMGGFISIEEIQETADIITFHVPLTHDGPDKTYHLADDTFFRRLRKKPHLINTSRGPVVDTNSVKNAVCKGEISGFAADVWENEPDLDLELLKMADIATPHIAGYSVEGKANGTAACIQAASRFFGFGLDNWYPSPLPPPAKPIIELNAAGKTDEQIISQAIRASYNIMNDDTSFRKDPSQFENLRNHYPVRREFEAFSVKITNAQPGLKQKLINFGFKVN